MSAEFHKTPCDGFEIRVDLGPVCPSPEGWAVQLADGSMIDTHGPDPILTPLLAVESPTAQGRRAPDCVADPAADYHGLLIYARPVNRPDLYEATAPLLRAYFAQAGAVLAAEALAHNVVAEYRMRCLDGLVEVANAVLPTPSNQDSFSSIVNNLKALGYGSTRVKYWVWYDDTIACGCSGIGTINSDNRLLVTNANNVGPDYGVTFGPNTTPATAWRVMMHENGHNQGAVQHAAPNASGGFHCNDGQDVMCYDDGGPTSNYNGNVCLARIRFDCNNNDYFHAAPAADNYLATHWNLGSPLNRFLSTAPL